MLHNSNNNDINLLDIQPPKIKYSKYAHSLDRLFKSASLKALQYNIRHPKTYKLREFYEESKYDKKPLDNPEYFKHLFDHARHALPQIEKLKSNVSSFKTLEIENGSKNIPTEWNQKENAPEIENIKLKRKKKLKDKLTDYPEPGKYNPNYNMIFRKSPAAVMHLPIKSSIQRLPPINNISITSENKARHNSIDVSIKSHYVQDVSDFKISRKNHALKFSQYPNRKEEKKWVNPIVSYLQEIDYISHPKGIDFEKMKPRSENDLIDFNSLNNPAVGYYEPKYEFVMKSPTKGIRLKPKDDKEIISPNKQYLVKKLWRSYENPPEYKLVKF